jgi:Holliday junction resolvase RusA-like endonuclease
MIVYEIPGIPIALKRHRHVGKKCYDSQKKEKEIAQWHIKYAIQGLFAASEALKLVVEYHMPIPKSYSKRRAKEALRGPHTKKPDLTNLIKFTEDAFNGMVWEDDSIISEIEARKFYSDTPKTVFKIENISKKIFEETCVELFPKTKKIRDG